MRRKLNSVGVVTYSNHSLMKPKFLFSLHHRPVVQPLCPHPLTLWWRSRPLITIVWCTPQTKSFCLPPAPRLPRKPCVSACVCVCGTARDWLLGARCFPIKPVTGVWEPPSMSGAERVLLGQTVLSCYGDVWTAWCTRIEPHHTAGLHYEYRQCQWNFSEKCIFVFLTSD